MKMFKFMVITVLVATSFSSAANASIFPCRSADEKTNKKEMTAEEKAQYQKELEALTEAMTKAMAARAADEAKREPSELDKKVRDLYIGIQPSDKVVVYMSTCEELAKVPFGSDAKEKASKNSENSKSTVTLSTDTKATVKGKTVVADTKGNK